MKKLCWIFIFLIVLPIAQAQEVNLPIRIQWRQDNTIFTTDSPVGFEAIENNIMNTAIGPMIKKIKTAVNKPEVLAEMEKLDRLTGTVSIFIIDVIKWEFLDIQESEVSISLVVDGRNTNRIRIVDENLRTYRRAPVNFLAKTLEAIRHEIAGRQ